MKPIHVLALVALQGCGKVIYEEEPDALPEASVASDSATTDTGHPTDTTVGEVTTAETSVLDASAFGDVDDAICAESSPLRSDAGLVAELDAGPLNCVFVNGLAYGRSSRCPPGSVCDYGRCITPEAFAGCADVTPCGSIGCFSPKGGSMQCRGGICTGGYA